MYKKFYLALALMLFSAEAYATINYNATVSIDFSNKIINGKIIVSSGVDEEFSVKSYGFYDIAVNNVPVLTKAGFFNIEISKIENKVITYKKALTPADNMTANFISINNIVPVILDKPCDVEITVSLPKGFEAIMQSELTTRKVEGNNAEFKFRMSKPVESFDLIAATNYRVSRVNYKGVDIYSYLFTEDSKLATDILEATKRYIGMYIDLFGIEFPYKRFSVVEHIFPVGYASPTFTAIGKMIISQPFVIDNSLGHEVLHQWLGVAVGMDNTNGNWAEGITTYFADHKYKVNTQADDAYRKETLRSYEAFTKDNQSFPISQFYFNNSKLAQSIGYGKVAMLIHQLTLDIGEENLMAATKAFIQNNLYKKASWQDFFKEIETVMKLDNATFAYQDYWLNSTHTPELKVTDIESIMYNTKPAVKFNLERTSGLENMLIPYTIFYSDRKYEGVLVSKSGLESHTIEFDEPEAKLVIDNDYDIIRVLSEEEKSPILAEIFGSKKLIGVVDVKNRCSELLNYFNVTDIYEAKEVTLSTLKDNDVIICGYDNIIAKSLFDGLSKDGNNSSEYATFLNPYNHDRYILVVENPTFNNIRLLTHYTKYSTLKFKDNVNIFKEIAQSDSGIVVIDRKNSAAIETTAKRTLDDVVKVASIYPAVFIGERHDNYAHHLNQLEIIKRLHKSGAKIAVGFEQIQKQFQPALDDFVKGKINELEFLERTEYFDRWSYDYALYAPIFRYIRDNKIKGLALNIDGVINRKVSNNAYDNVTEEEFAQIPKNMNLNNSNYIKFLKIIFKMHQNDKSFANFYLAQNIWDETMAESIYKYQKQYPNVIVVVIAGVGHLDKNTGIPLRYERLTGKKGFVIHQDTELDANVADIVLFTEPIKANPSAKLGVSIVADNSSTLVVMDVIEKSPAALAGIQKGDKILECADRAINNINTLRYTLFEIGLGKEVKCVIERNGVKSDVVADLFEYSQSGTEQSLMERMMMKMQGLESKK